MDFSKSCSMKHLLTKAFYFKSMYLVSKMGSNIELSLSAPIDLSKTSSCCTMQCLSCLVRSEFFPKVGENFHCLWSLLHWWLACQRWMLTVISMQPLHTVSFSLEPRQGLKKKFYPINWQKWGNQTRIVCFSFLIRTFEKRYSNPISLSFSHDEWFWGL